MSMPLMSIKDAITLLRTYDDQDEDILIVWQRKSQGIDEAKVEEWTERSRKRVSFIHKNPTRNTDWPTGY
jgi:hypothetical protein|tara:strand:- start:69 stop:278 length:210 start_codon:yes stop_codon:yes gene_type:complete